MQELHYTRELDNKDTALALIIQLMLSGQPFRFDPIDERFRIATTGKEALPSEDPWAAHCLVQEGGTSAELYIHSWETGEEAEADRVDCANDGSYATSSIIVVPAALNALGEIFYVTAQAFLVAAQDLEVYTSHDAGEVDNDHQLSASQLGAKYKFEQHPVHTRYAYTDALSKHADSKSLHPFPTYWEWVKFQVDSAEQIRQRLPGGCEDERIVHL